MYTITVTALLISALNSSEKRPQADKHVGIVEFRIKVGLKAGERVFYASEILFSTEDCDGCLDRV
jgi:hypothetical protein